MKPTKEQYLEMLQKQKESLEARGYEVAYVSLYGSQNYELDFYSEDYKSDVDMKAVVMPTLDQLVANAKPVSFVEETEFGQCDVKDVRAYSEQLVKGSPVYFESLFTEFYVVDEEYKYVLELMRESREKLAQTLKYAYLRAAFGMALEKQKALCHPYPSTAEKVEKFGYDGKQAHHVLRLLLQVKDFMVEGKPMEQCFYPGKEHLAMLEDLKLNKVSLEFVTNYVSEMMAEFQELRTKLMEGVNEGTLNYETKFYYQQLGRELVRQSVTKEVLVAHHSYK